MAATPSIVDSLPLMLRSVRNQHGYHSVQAKRLLRAMQTFQTELHRAVGVRAWSDVTLVDVLKRIDNIAERGLVFSVWLDLLRTCVYDAISDDTTLKQRIKDMGDRATDKVSRLYPPPHLK